MKTIDYCTFRHTVQTSVLFKDREDNEDMVKERHILGRNC